MRSGVIERDLRGRGLSVVSGGHEDRRGEPALDPDALNTIGASVSIPLRIFDRNQGEKFAQIDISRNEKLRQGVETQVYSDVDSAYATLSSNVTLLRPYKQKYLAQAVRVRDTILSSPTSTAARRCWTSSMQRAITAPWN